MFPEKPVPKRYVGLDIHKHYLLAIAVDADLQPLFGPQRVELSSLENWIHKILTTQDAVVLEMTTNTWQVYDELQLHVGSVTVVHPPHEALITRSQVMTDKIAASHLARLHAKGLLVGIWVPPQEVRDLRALVAQRNKMTRFSTQAKNRLHSTLHRHHLPLPEGDPFLPERRSWWLSLPLTSLEHSRLLCDLDTLLFARLQIAQLEANLNQLAAEEKRLPLLVQLPGVSLISAFTILAALGVIERFPDAKSLVGYAGLGGRVHDSGLTTRTGRITKAGRKDLRAAMVEAAQTAANFHPHWKAELARLEPRLGRNKAVVAIARKLLIAVWHVLTFQVADKYAQPVLVARKLMQLAYKLGKSQRLPGMSSAAFVRLHLDRLYLAHDLAAIPWGAKKKPIPLPPSTQLG